MKTENDTMDELELRNQKIIDAVLEKEKAVCPGAIALIGIYGSFLTGDVHPLSDLDLLILINDERGWQLGKAFFQEDLGVGHDIYCTSWEMLRRDACYEHPYISKLMDSRIVYCAEERYRQELLSLRCQLRELIEKPFSEADLQRAENALKEASLCYADALTAEALWDVRRFAGGVLYHTENAVALLNKTYFRRGVRRQYEELNGMEKRPEKLCERIEAVVSAGDAECLKEALTLLMKEMKACFRKIRGTIQPGKKPASAEALSGTWEEMFSNWHGKMLLAAECGDRHLAFMSLSALNEMLSDLSDELDLPAYHALQAYEPGDLRRTAEGFDAVLRDYGREYEKAGLQPERYVDIDSFVTAYLRSGRTD